MRGFCSVLGLSFLLACSSLKESSSVGDGGSESDAASSSSGGSSSGSLGDGGTPGNVTVETLVTGRTQLGARSSGTLGHYRTGLAVKGDRIFWVERGSAPGVYGASSVTPCKDATCVSKLTVLTRPVAFTTNATHLFVADVGTVRRVPLTAAGTPVDTVASEGGGEIVNLGVDTTSVFYTVGTASAIRKAAFGGAATTPITSNGTPIALGVAGTRVFWAGVDISGQTGLLQSMNTDGTNPRGLSSFSGGFHSVAGNGTYAYYATGRPGVLHRLALASGRDEIVLSDATLVQDFAFDNDYAYWVEAGDPSDYSNGRVRRVAHGSKDAETLATSLALPVAIALQGNQVFVATAGSEAKGYADGSIVRLTIGGN